MKQKQIPLALVLLVGLLILAAAGYFALIKPKQSSISSLEAEVMDLETELQVKQVAYERAVAEAAAGGPAEETQIEVADLVRLSKAMPDDADISGLLVELDSIAESAGIEFLSIQPLTPISNADGYTQVPVNLTFTGSYFDLTEVLYQLRNLVRVRDGELTSTGRLFTLDTFDLHEAEAGFPEIEALLTVSAYSYGTLDVPEAGALPGVFTPVDGDDGGEQPGDDEPADGGGDEPPPETDPDKPPPLPDDEAEDS